MEYEDHKPRHIRIPVDLDDPDGDVEGGVGLTRLIPMNITIEQTRPTPLKDKPAETERSRAELRPARSRISQH